MHTLVPMGVRQSAGVSCRHAFAGGAETERIIRQIAESRRLRQPGGLALTGRGDGWATEFVPEYRPERKDRATRWTEAVVPPPPQWDEEQDAQPAAPNAVPRDVGPTGRLEVLCTTHRRPICAICRSAKGRASMPKCCAIHHDPGDPPKEDFCARHRLRVCGTCRMRRAEECCRHGHHRCTAHDRGPCDPCARLLLRERRPTQCCAKGHHKPPAEKRRRSEEQKGRAKEARQDDTGGPGRAARARPASAEQGRVRREPERRRGRGSPDAYQD